MVGGAGGCHGLSRQGVHTPCLSVPVSLHLSVSAVVSDSEMPLSPRFWPPCLQFYPTPLHHFPALTLPWLGVPFHRTTLRVRMWKGGPRPAPYGWTSLRTQTSRTRSTIHTRLCRSPRTSTKAVSVQSDREQPFPPTMGARPTAWALPGPRCPSTFSPLPTPRVTHAHLSDLPTCRHRATLRHSLTLTLSKTQNTEPLTPMHVRAHTNACTQLFPHVLGQVPTCPQSSSSLPSPIPWPHAGRVEDLPHQMGTGQGATSHSQTPTL